MLEIPLQRFVVASKDCNLYFITLTQSIINKIENDIGREKERILSVSHLK